MRTRALFLIWYSTSNTVTVTITVLTAILSMVFTSYNNNIGEDIFSTKYVSYGFNIILLIYSVNSHYNCTTLSANNVLLMNLGTMLRTVLRRFPYHW